MNSRNVFLLLSALILLLWSTGKPDVVSASGDGDPSEKLRARVAALERLVEGQQVQLQELQSLKLRLIRLEQSVQDNRPGRTGSISASASEIAKLKQDSATLKSSVRRLESKFSGFDRSNLQRDIGRLDRKVSTLESAVRRLESKR